MSLRAVGSWLLLSLAFVAGTWVAGWWALPVVGSAWGLLQERTSRRAPLAAVAAASGWGGILAAQTVRGPVGELAAVIGPILSLSGLQLLLLTLAFAAAVASAAAAATGTLRDVASSRVARADAVR